jgi:hypothetical protein
MFSIGIVIIGILSVILPIAISILIIVAIVKAVQANKQEDAFEKFENGIRSFYVYLILICFLFCTIGSTVYLFNSGMNLLLPKKESRYSSYYDEYDSSYTIKSESTLGPAQPSSLVSRSTTEKNMSIVDLFTAMAFLGVSLTIFIL